VLDDYFPAHLFDYETENKNESKFVFSTLEKVVAQSLLEIARLLATDGQTG
jgi:hypothetical protein